MNEDRATTRRWDTTGLRVRFDHDQAFVVLRARWVRALFDPRWSG
ncbi:MAG: hypothetical protein ACRDQ4_03295 [Pseudonocardiaceae bacterium]